MRSFIRHPIDIPINCMIQNHYYCVRNALLDMSVGGLSFATDCYIAPGEIIHVNIYVQEPKFETDCEVRWCKQVESCYHVGVAFQDAEEAFTFRMVEQICHIEHYKRKVQGQEGRLISGEQAASEWIDKYAQQFPR